MVDRNEHVTRLEEVVREVRNAKGRVKKCGLLIGAGCSATANIPLAQEIVDKHWDRYKHNDWSDSDRNYVGFMGQLTDPERREVIDESLSGARINWAHLAISQLILDGYVDRVMTTNFDQLIVQTCAMQGVFPAVYDVSSLGDFRADVLPKQAVFHLHGQQSGFIQLHDDEDYKNHDKRLKPVFDAVIGGRPWIVIGYSGECDPVLDRLAEVEQFGRRLFWIPYNENPPGAEAMEKLLGKGKTGVHCVYGYDADRFFIELCRELGCFPPSIIDNPFTNLRGRIEKIVQFPVKDGKPEFKFTDDILEALDEASDKYNETAGEREPDREFIKGDFEKITDTQEEPKTEEERFLRYWALIEEGNKLHTSAKEDVEQAEQLYEKAADRYERAVGLIPSGHEALKNWGIALAGLAREKEGDDRIKYFEEALGKYEAALNIKPDKNEALNNWGIALAGLAREKEGDDRIKYFEEACQKYEAALNIKPDYHEALYNWGNALDDLAREKEGDDRIKYFEEALGKYEAALNIKPDYHEALYNWGIALAGLAREKEGDEQRTLLEQAIEKCEAAEKIKPGFGAYDLACAYSLLGDFEQCRHWLTHMEKHRKELPSRNHIETDTDLDPVRNEPWFAEWFAQNYSPPE